jgi:hypothetical protein
MAQKSNAEIHTTYTIGGVSFQRIRFGEETGLAESDSQFCRDCGVKKGEYHVPTCEVERCPACGGEAISCECAYGQKNCA